MYENFYLIVISTQKRFFLEKESLDILKLNFKTLCYFCDLKLEI